MPDEAHKHHQGAALRRAIEAHGDNYTDDYESGLRTVMVQALVPLLPVGLFAGAAAGAIYAPGWGQWASVLCAALVAKLTFNGLRGVAWLFRNAGTVVLAYDDRFVYQRGADVQEIRWDDIEAVYLHTAAGDGTYSYPPGHPDKASIDPDPPLINFWTEWTDVRLRSGHGLRIPSTIWDYEGLSRTIQGEASARRIDGARARHRAGEPLTFGPLTIRPDGLQVGADRVDWRNHWCTWADKGFLVSADTDGVAVGDRVRIDQVPNPGLVVRLVGEISERHAPEPADDAG